MINSEDALKNANTRFGVPDDNLNPDAVGKGQSNYKIWTAPIGTPELNAALAKAQAEFKPISKNASADLGSYGYSYATLAEIIEATKDALCKYGLCLPFTIDYKENIITGHLRHSSGQEITSSLPLPANLVSQKPQTIGSILTYFRRYIMTGLLNIAADDDDDGNAANGNKDVNISYNPFQTDHAIKSTNNERPPAQGVKKVSEKQLNRLYAISTAAGWLQEDVTSLINKKFKVESSKDLVMSQYDVICKFIEGHKKPVGGDDGPPF